MFRQTNSKKRKLIRDLVKHADRMIQAGMSQSSRTCGTPSCGCHLDARRRHGPHTYLTFRRADGKSTAMYVSPENEGEARKSKCAWDDFWETATELAALNREELRAQWQAAGKARRAKR